jgi:hypothetical protein
MAGPHFPKSSAYVVRNANIADSRGGNENLAISRLYPKEIQKRKILHLQTDTTSTFASSTFGHSTNLRYYSMNSPLAFPSMTMVERRVRWALLDATSSTDRPTNGVLVEKAAGCEVKATAEDRRAAKQKNLIVASVR